MRLCRYQIPYGLISHKQCSVWYWCLGAEYPDDTWPEEKVAALLQSSVSKGDTVFSGQRVRCLELLSKKTVTDKEAVFPSLVEVLKTHGNSEPEASLLITILGNFVEDDGKWADSLLEILDKKYEPLVWVIARVLRNVRKTQERKRVIDRLVSLLFTWGTFTRATNEIYETITSYGDQASKSHTMKQISQYLGYANGFEAVYAMRIASRLGTKQITPKLCEMAEKSMKGFYAGYETNIQEDFYNSVRRLRDRSAKPTLLKLLRASQSLEVTSALASIADRSMVNDVMAILADSLKKNYQVVERCIYFLDRVDPVLVDPAKLLALCNQVGPGELNTLVRIVERLGKRAKLPLLNLLRSDNEANYALALECLTNIETTMEELSKAFARNPRHAIYDFLYRKQKLTLEDLWKEKEKLSNSIRNITRLDHFILNLFNSFGFVSMHADPAGHPGIDVVSFSPCSPHLLLIGCTTGIPKDDLQQLQASTNELRQELPDIVKKLKVLPVMVTSKGVELHPTDLEYATKNEIAILVQEDAEKLMVMLQTQRTPRDVIHFLTSVCHKTRK